MAPSVAQLREAKSHELDTWFAAMHALAHGGRPFSAPDVWLYLGEPGRTTRDRSSFYTRIRGLLMLMVSRGLLDTGHEEPDGRWPIRRLFWRTNEHPVASLCRHCQGSGVDTRKENDQ